MVKGGVCTSITHIVLHYSTLNLIIRVSQTVAACASFTHDLRQIGAEKEGKTQNSSVSDASE